MKEIQLVVAVLLILVGIIHIVATPVWFEDFGPAVLWYVGSGLALLFLGFLNIACTRRTERDCVTYWLTIFGNGIGLLFAGTLLYFDREAMSLLVFILIATAAGTSYLGGRALPR